MIGLGALGQLATQLLNAHGYRVIGVDLDRRRIDTAFALGMAASVDPQDQAQAEQVARLTGGVGADGVIITAATASDEVVSAAFKMCRKKGRVVLVGDVGLNLKRADMYQKELDFFISCSYGPGRYDSQYEEGGVDYPIGYVRWTENRNMAEYLRLVAQRRVNLEPLIASTFAVEDAADAYEALKAPERPLLVLLSYADSATPRAAVRTVANPSPARADGSGADGARRRRRIRERHAALPNLHELGSLCHLRAIEPLWTQRGVRLAAGEPRTARRTFRRCSPIRKSTRSSSPRATTCTRRWRSRRCARASTSCSKSLSRRQAPRWIDRALSRALVGDAADSADRLQPAFLAAHAAHARMAGRMIEPDDHRLPMNAGFLPRSLADGPERRRPQLGESLPASTICSPT